MLASRQGASKREAQVVDLRMTDRRRPHYYEVI